MRFHVIGFPHTMTTDQYCWCAYTDKVRKFCNMMKSLGHTVFLYGTQENAAACDEHIVCFNREDCQADKLWLVDLPAWKSMNDRVIIEIDNRKCSGDFICIIAGVCQKPIADAFPDLISVEYGIGYNGVFSAWKVFESYAWMHTIYGKSEELCGKFYDVVIPNYFDVDKFPYSEDKDDYFLYIGRLTYNKGYNIACEVCKHLNVKLIIAGEGEGIIPEWVEYRGLVGVEERGKLMSKAKAVFVPTIYIEPFGGVAVEAMMCGTPVITTDWGVFPETVLHGKTGYRCRTFEQFVWAAKNIDKIKSIDCRNWAVDNYSTDRVKYMYEEYFSSLLALWSNGWYQLNNNRDNLNWLSKSFPSQK